MKKILRYVLCILSLPAASWACTITCPANISKSNDPNQCGGVVTYPAPVINNSGVACGTVTCSPASGSFYPVFQGGTKVTCTASAGPQCTFTVTINDTQPPTITCPANVIQTLTDPVAISNSVTYPSATFSDNCPAAGGVCLPSSGSTFPVGKSPLGCQAYDKAGNTATCSFNVTLIAAPTVAPTATLTTVPTVNVPTPNIPTPQPDISQLKEFLSCTDVMGLKKTQFKLKKLGGKSGDESLDFKAELASTNTFDLSSSGAQIIIEQPGLEKPVAFELSARTAAISPGSGCQAGDGWTGNNYKNSSNTLPSAACSPGSAAGLNLFSIKPGKKGTQSISFKTLKSIFEAVPLKRPLQVTVILGAGAADAASGKCAKVSYSAKNCKLNGSTITCKK